MKTIKIASGSGFWGDWHQAPINQVRMGNVDYVILDYLAELTMSVLAKQKESSPELGYAYNFVDVIRDILPDIVKKKIKVISNAGGMNSHGCAMAIRKVAKELGFDGQIKIASVCGDDVTAVIKGGSDDYVNLDSGKSISDIRSRIVSANAYLGARPLVEALQLGADIVVSGRVSDAALALAPMIYEFNWSFSDYNSLSLGIVAGHLIECGAQASGGNCSYNWETIPDLANIGYPIIEISEDKTCYITKHANTGGRIDVPTVKEQLIYEISDPKNYLTPDVISDFTSVSLEEAGKDRVKISNAIGRPINDKYKVSVCYSNGYKAENSLIYSAPKALEKAKLAEEIFRARTQDLQLEHVNIEYVGLSSCHGNLSPSAVPNEILIKVSARGQNKKDLKKFSRELVPLVLSGPPSASGYTSGGKISEIYSFWPTLINKNLVDQNIKVELV